MLYVLCHRKKEPGERRRVGRQCTLQTSAPEQRFVKRKQLSSRVRVHVWARKPSPELPGSVAGATSFKDVCSVCVVPLRGAQQKLKKVRRRWSLEKTKRHSAADVCGRRQASFRLPRAAPPERSLSPALSCTDPRRGCASAERDTLGGETAWHRNVLVLKSSGTRARRRLAS